MVKNNIKLNCTIQKCDPLAVVQAHPDIHAVSTGIQQAAGQNAPQRVPAGVQQRPIALRAVRLVAAKGADAIVRTQVKADTQGRMNGC